MSQCHRLTPVTQTRADSWLHLGIVPSPGRLTAGYAALRASAVELLDEGRIREFFFLHKPPGLRVRYQPAEGEIGWLEHELGRRLRAWRRDGLVRRWCGGAYEPEEFLFGGPVSMRSVHRIFTFDSLAWLGFHTADQRAPAWAMSLLMVRGLLDALRIVGWEDLDVWDRLRWQAGRRFTGDGPRPEPYARVEAAFRAAWAAPEELVQLLPPRAVALVEDFKAGVAEAGARWWETYFAVGRPSIGPREAATFVTVFHWNRARLSILNQTLIAEALTARPGQAAP